MADEIDCYENLWVLGDNFTARTIRDGLILRDKDEMFMTTHFNITPCGSNRFTSNNTNMLSRIENGLIKALNDNIKLPKYIIIVLDDDIIEHLGYKSYGVLEMFGDWINYLIKSFKKAVHDRKSKLPRGAIRFEYPMFYWAEIPMHSTFSNNEAREKFNFTLATAVKLVPTMRVIKLKNIWDFQDMRVASPSGILSTYGVTAYWNAIDNAFKFNALKHEQYLHREKCSVYESLEVMTSIHRRQMTHITSIAHHISLQQKEHNKSRGHRNFHNEGKRAQDKFHWNRQDNFQRKRKQNNRNKNSPKAKKHINF